MTLPKIKDPRYAPLLKGELIEPVERKAFLEGLEGIEHKSPTEARVLSILLWATGGRPNEVLRLTGGDFKRDQSFLQLHIKGSKGGVSRILSMPLKDELTQEVVKYAFSRGELQYLFPSFISRTPRKTTSASFTVKDKLTGQKSRVKKVYLGSYLETGKVRHWIKKWFGFTPYFFRHSRFSIVAEKASVKDLMKLKGSKTEASVMPYLHQTSRETKKMGKELMK